MEALIDRKALLLEELAGLRQARGTPSPKGEVIDEIIAVQSEIRAALARVPEYIAEWPLSEEDMQRWVESRYWQFASTMSHNPHEYVLARWGDRTMFERVVLHVRERGYQNLYGRTEYTQLDCGRYFYWTMCDCLETTILINRKLVSLGKRRPPAPRRHSPTRPDAPQGRTL
jgi:hypothetical protein